MVTTMLPNVALDALGNPTRRAMLDLLRSGPRSVQEIADAFPVSRPAVSRHLRLLSSAGLVVASPVGVKRYYRLHPDGFDSVRAWCDAFWDDALPRFKTVAENLPEAP